MKFGYKYENVTLKEIERPLSDFNNNTVVLSDETMNQRKNRLLNKMKEHNIDTAIIYADREHGANFEYLTGFIPRFEEALLVISQDGEAYLLLGNENLKMAKFSRLKAEAIHVPHFSLPNQPMENSMNFADILKTANINEQSTIGLVGWKLFTSKYDDNKQLFDIPYYMVDSLKQIVGDGDNIINCAELFIGQEGVRIVNNADEISYYEYGASLSSDCVLKAMDEIELGKTDMELASYLSVYGQPHNVTNIFATGERFTNAVLYPQNKKVHLGDKFSITTGYKGGLTSRAGYIVADQAELPETVGDYLEKVAKPYYTAVVAWLENIKIGLSGEDMYNCIQNVLPKEQFNWSLNPGHLVADEEWMSSPIYPESTAKIRSGMLFQVDIIPSVQGYGGASAETGIALADEELRKEIQENYPQLWDRFEKRREYIKNVLNINLHPEVLPLSNTVGYYRPFALAKDKALIYKN
ncbi:M24 family metallopeptidase [Bacillus sp. Au-Bac7]|uniref:M24 family metallopeptidase n=1 Tax=Bacillus sp. Au-Bac7 TaxID=2906458 RepID=UPI001E5CACCA|nr:aminopeptidase P family protein [Bacillus sp. Au-Bac7]MCE4048682.1 aminopeptidase P family N-terminal domain-containing protein [Bacillus sp. Au-Bac7]